MANNLVIQTKLNAQPVARSCAEIQKDIDKVAKAQERLQERFEKFEFSDGNKTSKNFKKMQYDADKLNTKMFDLQEEMSRAMAYSGEENKASQIEKVKTASDRASKSVRKMGDSIKLSGKSFSLGLKNILKYVFGIRSVFVLVNKLRRALIDGFKNLAQFNNGMNPVNKAISNIQTSLLLLKNSFATAFSPILTTVEPLLTRLIDALARAATYMAQFMAALTGASTFTKAIKVQKDFAKALKGTGAAAKGSLSSFDMLNNISSDSGGGSGAEDPNKMFETAPIESKIAQLAAKLRALFGSIKNSFAEWFHGLDFQPLIESFDRLKIAAMPLIEKIAPALSWLFENVLKPIGKFTIENALPAFIDMLAVGLGVLNTILDAISPSLDFFYKKVLEPIGKFTGDAILWFIDTLKDLWVELGHVFEGTSITTVLNATTLAISEGVKTAIKELKFLMAFTKTILQYAIKVCGDIIDILAGVIDFFTGVFTGDMEKALGGLVKIFKGVFNGIIDIFEGVVNAIIDGLNTLSFKVPEWAAIGPLKGMAGKEVGLNLERLKLPRLASGTVVPRQASEFMAVLGDNNRETEVVSPLSTMKQAFIEALRDTNGAGGEVTINLVLDGEVVNRAVVKRDRQFAKRTGHSQFAY